MNTYTSAEFWLNQPIEELVEWSKVANDMIEESMKKIKDAGKGEM